MPGQPFSLANLVDTGTALYGRGWQKQMALELGLTVRTVQGWREGKRLPDLREKLIELCRRAEPFSFDLEGVVSTLESLGPPE